jgi:hypothetical protein
MKSLNKVLFATAVAAGLSLAQSASAQCKPTGDDGIAASPRVRQILNESTTPMCCSGGRCAQITTRVSVWDPSVGVTASPKVREMLASQKRVVVLDAPATVTGNASYRPTGDDGITASPRVRQQLDERAPSLMVAPVK